MKKLGLVMIVIAYALLIATAVLGRLFDREHSHLDPVQVAGYVEPWPVTLLIVFGLVGIVLALIPVRRGERWAIATSALALLALFAVRMTTDPLCLVVLDPHQHGCHSFMIAMALGLGGLGLAFRAAPHA
jgi:hypothetical protein